MNANFSKKSDKLAENATVNKDNDVKTYHVGKKQDQVRVSSAYNLSSCQSSIDDIEWENSNLDELDSNKKCKTESLSVSLNNSTSMHCTRPFPFIYLENSDYHLPRQIDPCF